MEKRTWVIIASVSVVAVIGAYFYFSSKKKEREEVFQTMDVEDDIIEDDIVINDMPEDDDVQWSQYGAVSVREDI